MSPGPHQATAILPSSFICDICAKHFDISKQNRSIIAITERTVHT